MKTFPLRPEALEQRIAPAVDLLLLDYALSLPAGGVTVPGDSVGVSFNIVNFGNTTANAPGGTDVELWLSANTTLGSFDLKLGNLHVGGFSLDPLEARGASGKVKLPTLGLPTPVMPAGNYHIIARLLSPVGESNTANNTTPSDEIFPYLFQFGNVGARKNVPLAIGGGDALKLTMSGAGRGEVAPDGALLDLTFTGTDGTSAAKLTAKEGFGINFDDITASSPLGSLSIFDSNVRGDLRFNGGIEKLVAGAIDPTGFSGDDSILVIGGALGKRATLDIFAMGDVDVVSSAGIAALKTHIWLDRNAATSVVHSDVLIAPFLDKLYVTPTPKKTGTVPIAPEFHADLYLTGDPSATYALNDVRITGPVMDATWYMGDEPDLDVNTVRLDTAADFALIASGMVRQFSVSTWDNARTPGPMFDAGSVGTFKVAGVNTGGVGLLGDSIMIRGADSKGVAIKNFFVTRVEINSLSAANGSIENLGVGDWIMETPITAKWIKNLAAVRTVGSVGDFAADVTLTGADTKGISLGTVVIQGEAAGDWSVTADAKKVTIDSTTADFEFKGDEVGQFTVKNTFGGYLEGELNKVTVGELAGGIFGKGEGIASIKAETVNLPPTASITAPGRIESLIAGEWTRGNLNAGVLKSLIITGRTSEGLGNLSNAYFAFDTAGGVTEVFRVAGRMKNVDITSLSANYDFIDFSADSWDTGSLSAGWVRKMTFDGGGSPKDGFLLDVKMNLYGLDLKNLTSLGTLKVSGAVDVDTRINLTNDAGSVTVGAFLNSFFQSQRNVGLFSVTGIKGATEPAFTRSEVHANQFTRVLVNDVDGGGGTASGFFAQRFGFYQRKEGGDVAFSQTNLAGVQGTMFDVIAPAYRVQIT